MQDGLIVPGLGSGPRGVAGERKAVRDPAMVSPVGLNTATEGQVKCSHPEEVRRS
jgi:hypothetical protein